MKKKNGPSIVSIVGVKVGRWVMSMLRSFAKIMQRIGVAGIGPSWCSVAPIERWKSKRLKVPLEASRRLRLGSHLTQSSRIVQVQYDGEGHWIDLWFDSGIRLRFEAWSLEFSSDGYNPIWREESKKNGKKST